MSRNRIAIIGASSYLSTEIIDRLSAKYDLLKIYRTNNPWSSGRDNKTIFRNILNSDLIINLAQADSSNTINDNGFFTNVGMNHAILNSLYRHKYNGVYLYLSSANLVTRSMDFGNGANRRVVSKVQTEWQLQKRLSERLIEFYNIELGLNARFLRVPNLFGVNTTLFRGGSNIGNSSVNKIILQALLENSIPLFKNWKKNRFFLRLGRVVDFIEEYYLKNRISGPVGVTLLPTIGFSYYYLFKSLRSLNTLSGLEYELNKSAPLGSFEMAQDTFPTRGVRYISVSREDFMMDLKETVSSIRLFLC